MAIRPRSRPARRATPPASAQVTGDGVSGDGMGEGAGDGIAQTAANGGASESLPDIKLYGKTVPALSREARIALAAYERAERRGFEPGYDLDDWLAAEREVDAAAFGESATDDPTRMGH